MSSEEPSGEARRLFAEFLERLDSPEPLDPNWLFGSHPEVEGDLRQLHGEWAEARALMQGLRKDPPRGEMDPAESSSSHESVVRALSHLARRDHGADRYREVEPLGAGGMGVVTRVWDADLRRDLAMKVIRGAHGAPGESAREQDLKKLDRFLDEAQVTAQLDHPGIPPVHEMGVDSEGRIYFTMKLVRGETLEDVIARVHAGDDGWSMTRALGVMVKVCEAMAYAHSKQVVHRDLKPTNVMVGHFGAVYVMDWGLARVLGRADAKDVLCVEAGRPHQSIRTHRDGEDGSGADSYARTMDGDALGTPTYMSPEQALGRLEDIGPRSDIYSAGAMLYHLLAGQPPYRPRGTEPIPFELLRRVIAGPPRSLNDLAPDVPAELVAICDKAMARDMRVRYASMEDFGEDLSAFLGGRVVRAYETGAMAEFRKWIRRNRAVAVSSAAAFLLALGGLASTALVQAAGKRAATRNAYLAQITNAATRLESDSRQDALRRLEQCAPEYRDWEWHNLELRTDSSLFEWQHGATVSLLAFSENGRRLAAVAGVQVSIQDPSSGTRVSTLVGHQKSVRAMAFSDAGTRIVTGAEDGTLRLWDVETGQLVRSIEGKAIGTLATDPRGSHLAAGGFDGSVTTWDVNSSAGKALEGHGGPVHVVAFSRERHLLASAGSDPPLRIWDVHDIENPQLLWVLEGHTGEVLTLDFSPDATRLVSGALDGTVLVWDLARGAVLRELSGHRDAVMSVAYSPDGTRVASGSHDGRVRVWNSESSESSGEFEAPGRRIQEIAFDPSGRRLAAACQDDVVRIWDLTSGRLHSVLRGADQWVECLAFSPDGASIAAGSGDGGLRLWAARTGDGFVALDGHAGRITSVAMAPDGTQIASADDTGALRIWSGSTGASRWTGQVNGAIHGVAFAADGGAIFTGTTEGLLAIWDPDTGEAVGAKPHPEAVLSLAPFPAGERVVTGCADARVRVWDLETNSTVVLHEHASAVTAVAPSPNGRLVASGSDDGTVLTWDVRSGRRLLVLAGHTGPVTSLAFHPDGKRLVSTSEDRSVRIWNVADGRPVSVLDGHDHRVLGAAFSPDGSRLATASWDRTVRLWDVQTLETVGRLSHPDPVSAIAFSSDGTRIVTGTREGAFELRIWLSERPRAQELWKATSGRP